MLRWRIAILVSVAIAISYLDRQTLPVAVSAIARDIPLSNQRFSALQSAFLLSYALMYLGGGKLVDALGTRIGFAVIMTFWSLANASHALATGFGMLMGSRFLLGMGEGGGFPAATRAVAEWFTPKERATAMGIINAGTAVGAVIAPPLIALILGYAGWRWIFLVTGGMGLLWTSVRSVSRSNAGNGTTAVGFEQPGYRAVECDGAGAQRQAVALAQQAPHDIHSGDARRLPLRAHAMQTLQGLLVGSFHRHGQNPTDTAGLRTAPRHPSDSSCSDAHTAARTVSAGGPARGPARDTGGPNGGPCHTLPSRPPCGAATPRETARTATARAVGGPSPVRAGQSTSKTSFARSTVTVMAMTSW